MTKKAKKNTTPPSLFTLIFSESTALSGERKKEHKRLTKVVLEGIEYLLMGEKNKKLTNKIKPNQLALLLYDTITHGSLRSAYYNTKTKELFCFTFIEEDLIEFEIIPIQEEEDRALKLENYFKGEPFVEITSSFKELASQYQANNILAVAVMFAAIVLIFFYIYFELLKEKETAIVSEGPPPMPSTVPLSDQETHTLHNLLALKVFGLMNEEIKKYEDRDRFNIQRIDSIEMGTITEITPSIPTLNEMTNTWEYQPGEENFKRGGIEVSLTIGFQKKYPSIGYQLEYEGDEEGASLYKKIEHYHFKIGLKELEENQDYEKNLDKLCMTNTLKMVDSILPSEQDDKYIHFSMKKEYPENLFRNVEMMFEKCPLEITSFRIANGLMDMEFKIRKSTEQYHD
ncbi:MAG TPA: hypothetical protein ENN12_03880 [Epsilonproteobacteria bacterium]|nr:hypothetical protein [Campylobacterota bacterium]